MVSVKFRTREALIATHSRAPFEDIPESLLHESLSFVAVPFLAESDAMLLKQRLPPNVSMAAVLPAENFDPPEDHPIEQEFTWAAVLINDFGGVNDDVGTTDGITRGHLRTLLAWQPRVDRERTSLIAIIAPGPWNRTEVAEPDSLPFLSAALVAAGYDAIAIRCKAGDDSEFV